LSSRLDLHAWRLGERDLPLGTVMFITTGCGAALIGAATAVGIGAATCLAIACISSEGGSSVANWSLMVLR